MRCPAGAVVRDVSGKFIVPGFVDTHAHWAEIRRDILEPNQWPFLANLAYGVTSGLDVQPFTVDVFGYQDMIDAGLMLGPACVFDWAGRVREQRDQFRSRTHATCSRAIAITTERATSSRTWLVVARSVSS